MNFSDLPTTENQLKKKNKVVSVEKQIKEKMEQHDKKHVESKFGKGSFILETDKPKCKHNCRHYYIYKFRHHCRYDYTDNLIKRKEKPKNKELERIINMNRS